ncbi:hypothetical protein ABZX12_11710 [Kribbella sp. NPDC003505]|uniref:hypothetical protein n=1 Tax=Kribbella sp. NPDC003505 TaxID=3154448 RepID=UPI0033B908BE
MPATAGQGDQDPPFALDHGRQLFAIGLPARRPQFVFDGVQGMEQFTNGAGIGISHDSLGKLEEFGARLSEAEPL